jgi:hypothetical protein
MIDILILALAVVVFLIALKGILILVLGLYGMYRAKKHMNQFGELENGSEDDECTEEDIDNLHNNMESFIEDSDFFKK